MRFFQALPRRVAPPARSEPSVEPVQRDQNTVDHHWWLL
jgi:hypothetical protein